MAAPHSYRTRLALTALGLLLAGAASAQTTSAAAQLARWEAAAGAPGQAARGQKLFSTRPRELSCASCHGTPPTAASRHASTGKTIAPLAPAFNAERFTDTAKVDKWLRRNCRDVFERECSAAEKADLMAYLLSLKR